MKQAEDTRTEIGHCLTCRWWGPAKDLEWDEGHEIINPPDPVTFDLCNTEEEIRAKWGHVVRRCTNPNILFYERPSINGAAVVDGSQYRAALLSAEHFGCVLYKPGG